MKRLEFMGEKLDEQTEKYKIIEEEADAKDKKLKHAESMQKAMNYMPQVTPLGVVLPKPRANFNQRSKSLIPEKFLSQPSVETTTADESKETDPDRAEYNAGNKWTDFGPNGAPLIRASILEEPEFGDDDNPAINNQIETNNDSDLFVGRPHRSNSPMCIFVHRHVAVNIECKSYRES